MKPFLLLLTLLFTATFAHADQAALTMRGIVAKYGSSVVTLSVVIKTNMSDDQTEIEASALVLNSSGLIVTTNTAIDPYSMSKSSEMSGIVSDVVSARVLLADGSEFPARVVLRDKDLNLAFVRPLKPLSKPLVALDFANTKATAQTADPTYLLGRLGKAGGRVSAIEAGRIIGVMEKPRRLYVLPTSLILHLGEAAFTEKGELLGLVSLRTTRSAGRSYNQTDTYVATIMPASTIRNIAAKIPK